MFNVHIHALDKMTCAYLLPIVPCVVAAASGGLIAPYLSPQDAVATVIVSYALLGSGMGIGYLLLVGTGHNIEVAANLDNIIIANN